MKKLRLFEKEEVIMRLFLKDHYSIIEASHIYDPNLPETARNHRTVTHYFYPFKEKGWFDSAMIPRKKKRGGRSTWERYRLNFNFYYELRGYKFNSEENKKIKQVVDEFLSEPCIREFIIKSKDPLLDTIDKLLFLVYRFSLEYYYNEFIDEWFPEWSDFFNDSESNTVIYKDVPKKHRVNAMIWKYGWKLTLASKKSKLLVDKNPLLAQYESAHKFLATAQKENFFDNWRKTTKPIKNRVE